MQYIITESIHTDSQNYSKIIYTNSTKLNAQNKMKELFEYTKQIYNNRVQYAKLDWDISDKDKDKDNFNKIIKFDDNYLFSNLKWETSPETIIFELYDRKNQVVESFKYQLFEHNQNQYSLISDVPKK